MLLVDIGRRVESQKYLDVRTTDTIVRVVSMFVAREHRSVRSCLCDKLRHLRTLKKECYDSSVQHLLSLIWKVLINKLVYKLITTNVSKYTDQFHQMSSIDRSVYKIIFTFVLFSGAAVHFCSINQKRFRRNRNCNFVTPYYLKLQTLFFKN